jgi:hypothetical protein
MTTDAIYLLGEDGRLEKVPYTQYAAEDVLQELIASYPELIVGEQIDPDDPPRWLLVSREAGVPDAEDSSDRWSLDHLLLDQHAVPTFVEVKRSSDTRIRREVIGQMLDYAANGTRYWPMDRIRALAAARVGGVDELDEAIRELLEPSGQDADVESYWARVEENLRAGRVRLLFVADELPRELRRVIEFLNEHMPKIDVLGVEIRHYAGGKMRALVPRVIGATERARQEKVAPAPRQRTSEEAFLSTLPDEEALFVAEVLSTARTEGLTTCWRTKGFSIRARMPNGQMASLLNMYPLGTKGRPMAWLDVKLETLQPPDARRALKAHLLALEGFYARREGELTVAIDLKKDNLATARAVLPQLWSVFRRIRETPLDGEASGPDAADTHSLEQADEPGEFSISHAGEG